MITFELCEQCGKEYKLDNFGVAVCPHCEHFNNRHLVKYFELADKMEQEAINEFCKNKN